MFRVLRYWTVVGASEFHTFANIQILNGRASLEHMSAGFFDLYTRSTFREGFFYFLILYRNSSLHIWSKYDVNPNMV